MQAKKTECGVWMVRLDRGDPIRCSLEHLARDNGFACADIHGLGAVKDVELGFYRLSQKEYARRVFADEMELVSSHGNMSLLEDGTSFLHMHVGLAREDYSMIGGHLFEAKVAVVGEFFVRPYEDIAVTRVMDDPVGLKLWDFSSCTIGLSL